jgi:hypothetical protein
MRLLTRHVHALHTSTTRTFDIPKVTASDVLRDSKVSVIRNCNRLSLHVLDGYKPNITMLLPLSDCDQQGYSCSFHIITVTTNPNWPEIKYNLLPGQIASNNPALVNRVFKARLRLNR